MNRQSRISIEDVRTDASMVDGRVSITADNVAATVAVALRDHRPLSRAEPHATVKVTAPGVGMSFQLDADQAAELRDALGAALAWDDEAAAEADVGP